MDKVTPTGGAYPKHFEFNGAGSIIEMYDVTAWLQNGETQVPVKANEESFMWSEEQTLTATKNNLALQHYLYDQNGERIMKANLREAGVKIGGTGPNSYVLDPYTVYVNPYYIATHYDEEVEASKHYYMGTQRIASAMISYLFVEESDGLPESGSSTSYGATQNLVDVFDYFGKTAGVDYDLTAILAMRNITSYENSGNYSSAIGTWCGSDLRCKCEHSRYFARTQDAIDCDVNRVIYWYHPDYLGNNEYVTDWNGDPYQYFWYSPWGESLEDQHKYATSIPQTNYPDSPFRFNGKELDAETGNYYYGARYYNPKYSIWLSVDPMATKYPSHSPYNFTVNNPVMFTDPTGMEIDWGANFFGALKTWALSYRSKRARQDWKNAKNQKTIHEFHYSSVGAVTTNSDGSYNLADGSQETRTDPDGRTRSINTVYMGNYKLKKKTRAKGATNSDQLGQDLNRTIHESSIPVLVLGNSDAVAGGTFNPTPLDKNFSYNFRIQLATPGTPHFLPNERRWQFSLHNMVHEIVHGLMAGPEPMAPLVNSKKNQNSESMPNIHQNIVIEQIRQRNQ